jgi:uncharacterized protein (DUF2252 family)
LAKDGGIVNLTMDLIQQLTKFNQGRDATGLGMKYRKMRSSAFSFLRGSSHLFYARLTQSNPIPETPFAWVCGDLHLENFGSYKADNRLVYFDINDFDEAALAPVGFDLVRMLCSVELGSADAGLPPQEATHLATAFLDAYAATLAQGKAFWVERETSTGLVRSLLDEVRTRNRNTLLDKFTDIHGKRRLLRLDVKRAIAATQSQQQTARECIAQIAVAAPNPDFYDVLDVAQRLAGTGSLGLERYLILVRGKDSPDGHYLLDLKRAAHSALESRLHVAQPSWPSQAHRIVELQRRMQAVSMAFLQPVLLGDAAYVLRGLQASEDRIELQKDNRQIPAERQDLLTTMGRILAWANLRSAGRQGSANFDALVAFGQETTWQKALLAASKSIAIGVKADWSEFSAAYDQGAFHA